VTIRLTQAEIWGAAPATRDHPDLIYAVHCLLAGRYGDAAPRPWRLSIQGEGLLVRGYVGPDWALPADNVWIPTVGDEVRVRIAAIATARRDGKERDVAMLWGRPAPGVYVEWLCDQIPRRGGGDVISAQVERWALSDVLRLTHGPSRFAKTRRFPAVHFLATVRSGHGFASFLRRGVGRHRAFGSGFVEVLP